MMTSFMKSPKEARNLAKKDPPLQLSSIPLQTPANNSATIERGCNKFAEVLGLGWDKSISRSWLEVCQNFNSLTGTFTKVSSKPGDKEAQTSCKESKENIYPAWTLSELCPQVPIPSESGQIGRNYFGLKELAERFVFIWNINNGWTWYATSD